MSEDIQKTINYVTTWLGTITPQQWYVVGAVFASICTTIGITAWVKRRHLKATAEKLATQFVVMNVAFWGFLSTTASFVLTQGAGFGSFLPFVSTHWPQISGGAIAVHSVASAVLAWWRERKAKNDLLSPQTIQTLEKAASDIPQPNVVPEVRPVTSSLWTAPSGETENP